MLYSSGMDNDYSFNEVSDSDGHIIGIRGFGYSEYTCAYCSTVYIPHRVGRVACPSCGAPKREE